MRIAKIDERWFDVPNDPDKAKIKIKNLSPGELSDINDECFKQDINYKKGKGGKLDPVVKQKSNPRLFRELPIRKSVVDWTNFFDREGNAMDCTPENVKKAIREIQGFSELVTEFREQLGADINKEKEDQQKN